MQIVGWGKRSAHHHPEASDPENIKRHRRVIVTIAALTPHGVVTVSWKVHIDPGFRRTATVHHTRFTLFAPAFFAA